MTDVKKFLFDTNDFTDLESSKEEEVFTKEQFELAQKQAFQQGKTEGIAETKKQQEEIIGQLLEKILQISGQLISNEDRREIEKNADATKLAMRVIHKLLPQLSKDHALSEIEHVIVESIETRKDEPRIAVTVPTIHLEKLKTRVDALAIEKGYAGKIILLADDNLQPTDCRVEWADGGAERLFERLFCQIDTVLTQAISGIKASLGEDITKEDIPTIEKPITPTQTPQDPTTTPILETKATQDETNITKSTET